MGRKGGKGEKGEEGKGRGEEGKGSPWCPPTTDSFRRLWLERHFDTQKELKKFWDEGLIPSQAPLPLALQS